MSVERARKTLRAQEARAQAHRGCGMGTPSRPLHSATWDRRRTLAPAAVLVPGLCPVCAVDSLFAALATQCAPLVRRRDLAVSCAPDRDLSLSAACRPPDSEMASESEKPNRSRPGGSVCGPDFFRHALLLVRFYKELIA